MTQKADPRPGYYYVTVRRPARRAQPGQLASEKETRYIAGPFPTHQEALDRVGPVSSWAGTYDPQSSFYEWGTARCEAFHPLRNPYQQGCAHEWKVWPDGSGLCDYCTHCGEGRA